jgi:hypothetical protein
LLSLTSTVRAGTTQSFLNCGIHDCVHRYLPRSDPRVCTADVRDYADNRVNARCAWGWHKRLGPSAFGCVRDGSGESVPVRVLMWDFFCQFLAMRSG